MANINIAVIGAAGSGKSTLIQRALGLRSLPKTISSSIKMSVNGVVYTVSLVELDLEAFDFHPDRTVQWPKQINGQIVPHMDGTLILYDVMNRDSITDLPRTLNALVYSSLPAILVACKCDAPVNMRQIDTNSIEDACLAEVETFRTAANVPESAKLCLGAMLRAIMANRNANVADAGVARRLASSVNIGRQNDEPGGKPEGGQGRNDQGSSDFSLLKGIPSPQPTSMRGSVCPNNISSSGDLKQPHRYSLSPTYALSPISPQLSLQPGSPHESSDLAIDSVISSILHDGNEPNASIGAVESFLDTEESDAESTGRNSDDLPILQRYDPDDRPAKLAGFTFDELVDRLLDQHMSRADSNFADIFLCLYRKFAAPSELFSAILSRQEQVARDTSTHYLIRTATQLRFVTMITKWVSRYPGDFASPQTRRRLEAYVDRLSTEAAFAAAAREMRMELQVNVMADDDTNWAQTDADCDNGLARTRTINSISAELEGNPPSAAGTGKVGRYTEESTGTLRRHLSEARSISSGDIHYTSDSVPHIYQSVEDYEAEAATLGPSSTLPLTKFRYHICMDVSDDDFADEITRIDWVMFSSIRVRDLVRHVSLSQEQKQKCKSLVNVNRMIDHFNHVARWVANLILMRDKAKHRAQMLEKFMRIALRLRQLNNYNGLAAVIAGINGSAVHRLAQTRALVTPDCQKRFMRLELLMSTQKSHFAYRLAWENSSLPRIPFIPLHRRDLVSAEEGSKTFVGPTGDRINWKKFEVLAEVILPIMRSQGTPYTKLEKHNIARELILDCKMPTDEEEIYQRSVQVEGSSSMSILEAGKKKFPWFQK